MTLCIISLGESLRGPAAGAMVLPLTKGLGDELEMSSKEVSQGRKPSSETVAGTTGSSSGLCICSENKTSVK